MCWLFFDCVSTFLLLGEWPQDSNIERLNQKPTTVDHKTNNETVGST